MTTLDIRALATGDLPGHVTGKAPKDSGAGTDQAEVCVGRFGAILRECSGSHYDIH